MADCEDFCIPASWPVYEYEPLCDDRVCYRQNRKGAMALMTKLKKPIVCGMAMLAALWLAACSNVATEPVAEVRLLPRIFELELKDNHPGSHSETGKIHLEYVELGGFPDWQVEDKINKTIRQIVGMDNPYDGSEDLTIKVRKAELGDGWLHVMTDGAYYRHGAANGHSQISSTYFNLANGEIIRLGALFLPGYQPLLNEKVKQWLAQQDYPNTFDGVKDDQCFYQENQYLYLCFSEYDIAPGAAGVVIVPVDKRELQTVINPSGLLAK